ncbi:hypothetical protein AVEN_274408-1 [Araneus ventricosus]|uniref:Uncharacterized protein n=1 Tax=Araneus ventricosus TaxID=182803 RepID=A0A4Y2E808_ARAVE|nr:hypothetical protein AVEN_274408-1 [Araneus ventricosus]
MNSLVRASLLLPYSISLCHFQLLISLFDGKSTLPIKLFGLGVMMRFNWNANQSSSNADFSSDRCIIESLIMEASAIVHPENNNEILEEPQTERKPC